MHARTYAHTEKQAPPHPPTALLWEEAFCSLMVAAFAQFLLTAVYQRRFLLLTWRAQVSGCVDVGGGGGRICGVGG